MLASLDRARQKWCPMARVDDVNGSWSMYYKEKGKFYENCIANDCMMWKWDARYDKVGFCGLIGERG